MVLIPTALMFIIIIRWNRSCDSDSAYSYTFLLVPSVRLSVCHIRAPCLNQLTGLDAILVGIVVWSNDT